MATSKASATTNTLLYLLRELGERAETDGLGTGEPFLFEDIRLPFFLNFLMGRVEQCPLILLHQKHGVIPKTLHENTYIGDIMKQFIFTNMLIKRLDDEFIMSLITFDNVIKLEDAGDPEKYKKLTPDTLNIYDSNWKGKWLYGGDDVWTGTIDKIVHIAFDKEHIDSIFPLVSAIDDDFVKLLIGETGPFMVFLIKHYEGEEDTETVEGIKQENDDSFQGYVTHIRKMLIDSNSCRDVLDASGLIHYDNVINSHQCNCDGCDHIGEKIE